MPNSKISALPSATTPLAGTETLPVVQGGITEQVSVANLTAGRTVSMSGATVTGLSASKPVFTDASDNLVSTGTVPTDQGGTGLTSFTANGVVYASSTTALTTSSGLTYNGTTFATTGNATLGDATTDTVTVNGYMGVGGAPNPAYGIRVLSTALTGAQQIGYDARVVGTTSATSSVRGYVAVPGTADAVFTCSETIGFLAASPARGAASTITTSHGVYISDQNQATNNYGVTSLVSSGSNKWNIYASGTANNAFAGSVRVGSTVAPAYTLDVTGTLHASGNSILGDASTDTVTVNGYMGVGGAGNASYGVNVVNSALTGTSQYGIIANPTVTSAATANATAIAAIPATAAAAVTYSQTHGLRVFDATKGAGGTITTQYGIRLDDQTQGGTNYGINLLVSSGSNKWNIYASGTANNAFAGNVRFGGVTAPTVAVDVTGAVAATTTITSSGATSGVGYRTGAGGAVTQATSRTTGVTLNNVCGAITLFTAAGSATATTFTVTNSAVAATDTIVVNQKSGTNLYVTLVTAVAAGSFNITFYTTGGTASDAPVFNFAVIKAVAA